MRKSHAHVDGCAPAHRRLDGKAAAREHSTFPHARQTEATVQRTTARVIVRKSNTVIFDHKHEFGSAAFDDHTDVMSGGMFCHIVQRLLA